jgi:HNH endonuclease
MQLTPVPLKGFEGQYVIYPDGRVCGIDRLVLRRDGRTQKIHGVQIRHWLNKKGYPSVQLHRMKRPCPRLVHRLLADHFIPNPSGLPLVNHKDGIKTNFALDNLEWITNSGNMIHAYRLGLRTPVGNSPARYVTHDRRSSTYRIARRLNGKQQYYGRFKSLADAIAERDRLFSPS